MNVRIAVAFAFVLSGCATIVEGTTQKIGVSTTPVSGANCVLTNARGSWSVTTPAIVEVKRSTTDMVITCKKDGWADGTGTLHSHTSDGTTATALLWGPIGVGIDAASGATFHYPDGIEIPLKPLTAAAATTGH